MVNKYFKKPLFYKSRGFFDTDFVDFVISFMQDEKKISV